MRVLAGIYKSKKIETINNADTRPMMSKVREAIFNSIQFMVEEKDVLDLYSGSGSLGIEALSRGANYVTFVELSKECISICLLYTSPSPRDQRGSRMPSSA